MAITLASPLDRATTALSSPRVLLTLALVGALALAAGYLARRRGARPLVALGAAAVPVTVAAAILVAPYFRIRTVEEALPGDSPAPSATATATTTVTPTATPATTGTPVAPASPAGPVTVADSRLRGLGGHRASGRILLYRLANGDRVVRFEGVDIEGTPTPRVYFVPGAGRSDPGGHAAGPLKAERGSFNYPVPASVTGTFTVLVWCERFAVPIAGATLA